MSFPSREAAKDLYKAFDLLPLSENLESLYVDCKDIRGGHDIIEELGTKILLANQKPTYQLLAGQRGVGKSTELHRLYHWLKSNRCFVVYWDPLPDIDLINLDDSDILFFCAKKLISSIEILNSSSLLNKDLRKEVEEETITSSVSLLFVKTSTQIRKKLEPISPIRSLNELINKAKQSLFQQGYLELVLIVDNLDKISSHNIVLDYSIQLTALNCHVVHTIPMSIVYSQAARIRDSYDAIFVLPSCTLYKQDNGRNKEGLTQFREVIHKRVHSIQSELPLANVFETEESLNYLCLMSGGNIRDLLILYREVIANSILESSLIITDMSISKAVVKARSSYERTVSYSEWATLAEVARSKQIFNTGEYLDLIFSGSVLEYSSFNNDMAETWYDVHPLLKETREFQKFSSMIKEVPSYRRGDNINNTVLAGLDNVDKLYEEYLNKNDYPKIVEIANFACEMLDRINQSVEESELHTKIVALAEYWRLIKNLYASRGV